MVNQNFINLLAEGKPEYTDGGVLAEFTWLIVVLPFLAAILITFFGKYLPLQGAELALGTVLFIFSYSAALLYEHATKGIANEFFINVGSIGSYDLEFGWVVDGLSIMMYFVVGTVSSLVFIYATNYMQGEIRYTFFFTSLTLFAGSMLVLVSSPTLLQLLIGWELVGVCSYLLIGHYWEKKENSSAAMKAFITNKIAANKTDPTVGAAVCASGNHVCSGHIGTFTAKPKNKTAKTNVANVPVNAPLEPSSISSGILNVLFPLKYKPRNPKSMKADPNKVNTKNLILA